MSEESVKLDQNSSRHGRAGNNVDIKILFLNL